MAHNPEQGHAPSSENWEFVGPFPAPGNEDDQYQPTDAYGWDLGYPFIPETQQQPSPVSQGRCAAQSASSAHSFEEDALRIPSWPPEYFLPEKAPGVFREAFESNQILDPEKDYVPKPKNPRPQRGSRPLNSSPPANLEPPPPKQRGGRKNFKFTDQKKEEAAWTRVHGACFACKKKGIGCSRQTHDSSGDLPCVRCKKGDIPCFRVKGSLVELIEPIPGSWFQECRDVIAAEQICSIAMVRDYNVRFKVGLHAPHLSSRLDVEKVANFSGSSLDSGLDTSALDELADTVARNICCPRTIEPFTIGKEEAFLRAKRLIGYFLILKSLPRMCHRGQAQFADFRLPKRIAISLVAVSVERITFLLRHILEEVHALFFPKLVRGMPKGKADTREDFGILALGVMAKLINKFATVVGRSTARVQHLGRAAWASNSGNPGFNDGFDYLATHVLNAQDISIPLFEIAYQRVSSPLIIKYTLEPHTQPLFEGFCGQDARLNTGTLNTSGDPQGVSKTSALDPESRITSFTDISAVAGDVNQSTDITSFDFVVKRHASPSSSSLPEIRPKRSKSGAQRPHL